MSALSALYGRLTVLRRAWYARRPERRRTLQAPVISVGNLVVGGSGKTPVVAALARMLQAGGERPVILSRGYGRRRTTSSVLVVSDRDRVLAPVEDSGDEPQMLARALPGVPVLVCADRYRAGQLAEQRFAASVLLLDDGFQHVMLARTIDLLVTSTADLDEGVLPSGRLREPLSAARAADAVLVPSDDDDARLRTALAVDRLFRVTSRYEPLATVRPFGARLDRLPSAVVGVAAIARPARFFDALERQGLTLRRRFTFRDHHWFTPDEVARVNDAARDLGADVILTTEKDAVRLEHLMTDDGPVWGYLPMQVSVEPAAEFRAWTVARLNRERAIP